MGVRCVPKNPDPRIPNLFLPKLYEDKEVVLVKGLTDKELENEIYGILKEIGEPITINEIKLMFDNEGIHIGYDRITKALRGLVSKGKVKYKNGVYFIVDGDEM